MSDPQPCPKCGAPIPPDARWGMCPKCLLNPEAAMVPETPGIFPMSFGAKGRRFGDYELGPQLGKGGMGVVYEAVQLRVRRRVAVKMILDAHATSPAARRRFAIEAEAAAKLDHPNIVPIFEVGEHEEQPFLSMKLVEGESLRNKILNGECCVPCKPGADRKTALRARQTATARLMATVARAVHHAHQKGVIHRDLKPGNILVDGEGQPHLTDFGLAKILDEQDVEGSPLPLTHSSRIVGTPSYMSPEQALNRRVTTASDIFSLGAVFYELLTGEPPFKGHTLLETLRLVAEQNPGRPRAILPEIEPDLETICLKCLEKSPDARYESAIALAEDLGRWLKQEPIRARPAGVVLRARRWVRRNPVGAGLIASLCAALAATLMVLRMVNTARERDAILAAISNDKISANVTRLWEDPTQDHVLISSSDLAALDRRMPQAPAPGGVALTWVLSISDEPENQAICWAPVIGEVEERVGRLLGRPVLIGLRLTKARGWADSVVKRELADIQRISPLTFARAGQASPVPQFLAWEKTVKEGVIFARDGLGITKLAQVAGRRAAFAHTNSIVSFLAKVEFVRNGICSTNLAFHANIAGVDFRMPRDAKESAARSTSGEADTEDYAHREVIRKVLAGAYDVGVAQRRHFEMNKHKRPGLVELHSFPIMPDVYVARDGLPRDVVEALQKALLSFQGKADKKLLAQLRRSVIEGFELMGEERIREIRTALTNEFVRFEAGPPVVEPRAASRRSDGHENAAGGGH